MIHGFLIEQHLSNFISHVDLSNAAIPIMIDILFAKLLVIVLSARISQKIGFPH